MRDMIKLFIVVAVFSAVSGGLLSLVRNATEASIEINKLNYVKGPVVRSILAGCTNDPVKDNFKLKVDNQEKVFFVGVFNGRANTVAFEGFGKGFGGDVGVIAAIDTDSDKIVGIGVTTHSETPGLGARAKTDQAFADQFKGLSIKDPFKVKADGGNIDALSGATLTSRGVCAAITAISEAYERLKPEIVGKTKTIVS
jgi:electron transport complex protein RnfG